MNRAEDQVAKAYRAVHECLEEWSKNLEVYQGVMFDPNTYDQREGSAEYLLRMAVCDTNMASDSINGEVNRYPGLFSVPSHVIELTHALNEAKSALYAAVHSLLEQGYSAVQLRAIYREAGAPRLHPLQAWRQVPIIPADDLTCVGFTIAKRLSTSYMMSVDDSVQALIADNQHELANMILEQGATGVRWHKRIAKHVKANVVWGAGESRSSRLIYASMPFLMEGDTWAKKRVRFNVPRDSDRRCDGRREASIPLPNSDGAHITLVRDTA
jgi:hypothetical protein|tara:strand:+ start:54619 stop:55428 length:810 start_codon:yes stop_codon:yes gene_type:complete